MKKITVVLSLSCCLLMGACKNNNDTTTNMPDSGYKARTDTANGNPVTTSGAPTGGVAVDSVKNGQFNVSGVPDSAIKKQDSAGRR